MVKAVNDVWIRNTPKPEFVVRCPYCRHPNVESYWIKYLICEKCGKISSVPPEYTAKMIEAEKAYIEMLENGL